jgi:CNT family concentrative nucleoside transporter
MVIARAALGILILCVVAWLMSENRRKIPWRTIIVGVLLQIVLAALILDTTWGVELFRGLFAFAEHLMSMTAVGTDLVFGETISRGDPKNTGVGFVFALAGSGLPVIIFFSALVSILYYLGLMQTVVWILAKFMSVTMGASGAESMVMAANLFVGQTEAALTGRFYMPRMTYSELNMVMTGGFGTMAAQMVVIYGSENVLDHHQFYGLHLLASQVLSLPACFVMGKIIRPEVGVPETGADFPLRIDRGAHNLLEATATGTRDGLTLFLNVIAMLISFSALLALVDWPLHSLGEALHMSEPLSLGRIFGWILAPIAWVIGVSNWHDCQLVGSVMGTKIATNEFVGYLQLAKLLPASGDATLPAPETAAAVVKTLSPRAAILAVYAIADFANFVSIGIQLGGMPPLAPERKTDFARLALRAMIGGCLASYLTASIAGMFI